MESCSDSSSQVGELYSVMFLGMNNTPLLILTTTVLTIHFSNHSRLIGVYFPAKIKCEKFRYKCYVLVLLAWMIPIFTTLPSVTGKIGRIGLECKTRKCTVINMDNDGNPLQSNPKSNAGNYSLLTVVVLLLILKTATYLRLRVKLL